jgi:hypothetical protein
MNGLLRSLDDEIIPGSDVLDPYSEVTMQMLKIKAMAEAVRKRHCENNAAEDNSVGAVSQSAPKGIAISDACSEGNMSTCSSFVENSDYKCSTITSKEDENHPYGDSDSFSTSILSSTEEYTANIEETDFETTLHQIISVDSDSTKEQVKATGTTFDEDSSNIKTNSKKKEPIFFERWFSGGKATATDDSCIIKNDNGEEIFVESWRTLQCEENPVCDWVEL